MMHLANELDETEWMEEVADLAAFLMDSDVVMFGMAAAAPAPANDNDVAVFHGDATPAVVWVPRFRTVE
jgi:hypothetical protein